MDVLNFSYGYSATRWQITVRVDGYKGDNNGKHCISSSYVEVIQCGNGCTKDSSKSKCGGSDSMKDRSGCKVWRVTDEQLVRHMGCAMYLAFHKVIKYNREHISYYDFDEKVLRRCEETCDGDIREIEEKIRKYKTNDYIELWREVKCTLAAAIVVIGSFDWIHYQRESCKLIGNLRSTIEYIVYSLTFITKRDQSNSMLAQDILNNIQRHRCLYSKDVTIKICLGVEPIEAIQMEAKRQCTIDDAISDSTDWWEYFWIAVILLVIIFFIMWFLTKGAERRGHHIRRTYGNPLRINILPAL